MAAWLCLYLITEIQQVTEGASRVWCLFQVFQIKSPWPALYWGVCSYIVRQCEWVNAPLGFIRASSWTYCPECNELHQWRPPALHWHVLGCTLLCACTQWMSSPLFYLSYYIHQLLSLFWPITPIVAHSFLLIPHFTSFSFFSSQLLCFCLSWDTIKWPVTSHCRCCYGDRWKWEAQPKMDGL